MPIPQVLDSHGPLYRFSWKPFIHMVPAETLAEIFLLMRDSSTVSSISATRDHSQVHAGNFALLRMTAVCPRWRLVAINSSVLWNNIVFFTLEISSIRCAELFLGRTKHCALYIYISAPALLDTPLTSAPMHNLFVWISSESHRVRAFDFFATPKMNILYTYWAGPAINSRRIQGTRSDITVHSCTPFPQAENMRLSSPTWYVPGMAPCLKSLELRNNNGTASLSPLLRALGECLVLESLTLQGYRQFVDEDSDVPMTTLSELHRLHLFSCNSAPILASLHLPSLTHPFYKDSTVPRT